MTTPEQHEEPKKLTGIDKKLKRYDDMLRKNLEDYQNDAITNVVYKMRSEKIIK